MGFFSSNIFMMLFESLLLKAVHETPAFLARFKHELRFLPNVTIHLFDSALGFHASIISLRISVCRDVDVVKWESMEQFPQNSSPSLHGPSAN